MNLDKNIGWCTHTHNIATGCRNRELGICNVDACYARQTAENPFYRKAFPYGFEPHFYEERIHQVGRLRRPAIIFMDSMSDTFGSWWTDEQILKILHIMDSYRGVHWHKYVVLTKNPARMVEILEKYARTDGADRLSNVYFGTSVTGLFDERETDRIYFLKKISNLGYKTVLSMEPLIHDPVTALLKGVDLTFPDWIIIGGQTKPTKVPKPPWIFRIIDAVSPKPIYMKENCGIKGAVRIVQFPADLLSIARAWGKA